MGAPGSRPVARAMLHAPGSSAQLLRQSSAERAARLRIERDRQAGDAETVVDNGELQRTLRCATVVLEGAQEPELELEPEPTVGFCGLADIEDTEALLHICRFLGPCELATLSCVSTRFGKKVDWSPYVGSAR